MVMYLIKASLIWFLFLVLFGLLFRKSNQFRLNRFFLLTGMVMGLVLPLIPFSLWNMHYAPVAVKSVSNTLQNLQVTGSTAAITVERPLDWSLIALFIYGTGAAVFLIINIREVLGIVAMATSSDYRQEQGHYCYSTQQQHAPFSFMGRIFIFRPEQYEEAELSYILQHEAAHNHSRHWLDIIILQPLLVLFWFHPLVWIYRFFLKQQHEYEADAIASKEHTYEYGHFLLRQVMLKGAPAIAHSFYFSPIKNRIAMLTSNRKTNKWKYLAAVPALLCCSILMAKPADDLRKVRNGNVTAFKGNEFYWSEASPMDTLYMRDSASGKSSMILARVNPGIVRVNKDATHQDNLENFNSKGLLIADYYTSEFKKRAKSLPDNVDGLEINNLVLSAEGRIIYYEAYWLTAGTSTEVTEPHVTALINAITEESPRWSPQQGSQLPAYVQVGVIIPFKSRVNGNTYEVE